MIIELFNNLRKFRDEATNEAGLKNFWLDGYVVGLEFTVHSKGAGCVRVNGLIESSKVNCWVQ